MPGLSWRSRRCLDPRDVLKKARSLTNNARALEAVARLEEIYEILKIYGYEKYVSFDFGMLSKYQYYTGIIFQAYTYGTGEPMIKGGRYNGLMKHFGKPAASIGFAIEVDNLLLALSSQKLLSEKDEKPEVILYEAQERAEAIEKAQKTPCPGTQCFITFEEGGQISHEIPDICTDKRQTCKQDNGDVRESRNHLRRDERQGFS